MAAPKQQQPVMSKDEQIGYHKGSLSVLAKEREEFLKLLQVVEQLMHAHIQALKQLGVDLQAEATKAMSGDSGKKKKDKKKPIEDILK